jgi:SPP1 gp7 family putative phage head morphogenesis protein
MFEYSDSYIETLLTGVYDGTITRQDLPEDLYKAIADYLKKGLYEGFGATLKGVQEGVTKGLFEVEDLRLIEELRENIYMFSAAKTYQQVSDMQEILTQDDELPSWSEFKSGAQAIFGQYNENWLKAEYDTAIGQAQNAVKWNEIEKNKELMPYLRYNATEDDHECEICEPFNNLVAPVDDPIWGVCYPENHFRCRCMVDQLDKYEDVTLTSDEDKDRLLGNAKEIMDPNFQMNAGKDRVVFSDKHPYFDVAKGDKKLAKENFGLPIPEED